MEWYEYRFVYCQLARSDSQQSIVIYICISGGLFNGEGLWDQYWFTMFVCQNYAWSCKWRDGHQTSHHIPQTGNYLGVSRLQLSELPPLEQAVSIYLLLIPKSTWSQSETASTKVRSHHCRWPPAEKGVDRLCRWWWPAGQRQIRQPIS